MRASAPRNARTSAGSTSGATKACPMPRTRMKVSLPRFTFLSCAISVHQGVRVGCEPGHRADVGRQPDRRKMIAPRARPRCDGSRPSRAENSNAQHDAERDRLAVQQPVGKAGRRLERMAEGVAEIEQRALAGLALVARHDRGLAAAARPRSRARAPDRRRTRPASSPPARRRSRRRRAGRISRPPHSRRGIRAAEACRAARCRRSPGSADGTRRPGSCRGAELIPVLPPTEESTCASSVVGTCTTSRPRRSDRRGEAREIADHAAAERDHHVVALDARIEQPVADLLEHRASSSTPRPAARRSASRGCRRPRAPPRPPPR